MAVLVQSLITLRAEFNLCSPNRSKVSDGWIGDTAHQAEASDHNPDETGSTPFEDSDSVDEVHALDVTSKGPWPAPMTMQKAVDVVVARCSAMSPAACPLEYVIFNRTIWERDNGWRPSTYYGDDPHTEHAHFSARYGAGAGPSNPENFTGPYGLAERWAPMTNDDKSWMTNMVRDVVRQEIPKFLDVKLGDPDYPNRTVRNGMVDQAKERGVWVADAADTKRAALKPDSPLAKLITFLNEAPGDGQ